MKKLSNALLFESYSLFQVICFIGHIRRVDEVYFFDQEFSVEHKVESGYQLGRLFTFLKGISFPKSQAYIPNLVQLINSRAEIKKVSVDSILPHLYKYNHDSLDSINCCAESLRKAETCLTLYEIIGDNQIYRYFQAFLSILVPRRRTFYSVGRDLKKSFDSVTIVPNDPCEDFVSACVPQSERLIVAPYVERVNKIRYKVRQVKHSIVQLLLPLGFLLFQLRNGFGQAKEKEFDVAIPVIWGIFHDSEDAQVSGIKRRYNDEYLYGRDCSPGQVIHIFGDWVFPKEVEKDYQRAMGTKGFDFVRKQDYKVPLRFVRLVLSCVAKNFLRLMKHRASRKWDLYLRCAANKGVFYYLKKKLEMENIKYRVEYVKNDYNPAHIINTIVCHQENRKSVGMAHAASPYDCPQLAFAYFDHYFSICEMYARTFGDYWKSVNLVCSGRESVDWLFQRVSEKKKTKDLIAKLYGKRRFVATILFPGPSSVCAEPRWGAIYKGFEKLCDLDMDVIIFMRFRRSEYLEHPKVKPFCGFPIRDSRMVIDLTNFTTFDLISVSDLVVTANASFGINEALLAGKKVFTFGFTLKEDLYFPASRYGKDFVLTTPEDLVKIVGDMPNGFSNCEVNWEALLHDSDYYRDGHNCDRIRSIVVEESKKVIDLVHSAN